MKEFQKMYDKLELMKGSFEQYKASEQMRMESMRIRTQQKSQVLMQSEALWHWILHNEPPPNLDTLRPPPGRQQNKPLSGQKGVQETGNTADSDREKRII